MIPIVVLIRRRSMDCLSIVGFLWYDKKQSEQCLMESGIVSSEIFSKRKEGNKLWGTLAERQSLSQEPAGQF